MPGAVRVTHDVQPFVRGGLAVTVQNPANAVDENFGAASRDAVEPRSDESVDDFRHWQP